MQLIQFLLDNLFWVIAAITVLFSLFSRNKQGEEQEKERRTRPSMPPESRPRSPRQEQRPSTGPFGGPLVPAPPTAEPPSRPTPVRTSPAPTRPMETRPADVPEPFETVAEQGTSSSAYGDQPYKRPYDDPYRRETKPALDPVTHRVPSGTSSRFSSSDLSGGAIQGMMWAEVFGAPRGRKPYRPRNWR